MLCYSHHQTLWPCRSGNGKAFVFLRFSGTMLHRVIVLPQQPYPFFSLSAFAVGAAGVQQHLEWAEFLHGLWVGNSVLKPRLARNWAPDFTQCLCAVGKHGGTNLTGCAFEAVLSIRN